MELKNELLKSNRELETRIKTRIDKFNNDVIENLSEYKDKINSIKEYNDKVINSVPNLNDKMSKIDLIEKSNLKIDNKLSSHELRITTILNEIEKIKTKYDKIVLDNLLVPGYIGGGQSKFINLSEYLAFNIKEFSLLKLGFEQLKKDSKNIKNKQNYNIKQIVNLVDGSVNRCNEYTDNKQKDFQLLLENKMKEFNEKVMEIRMNVLKIQMKTEDEVNNLHSEYKKLIEEKIEFTNIFQNKLSTIEKDFSNFHEKYKTDKDDINQKSNNLEKDVGNIKDNIKKLSDMIKKYQINENKKNNVKTIDSEKIENKMTERKSSLILDFDISKNRNINDKPNYPEGIIRRKEKRNSVVTKNVNIINKLINSNININNGIIKRKINKRKTMFYNGPTLNLQMNNYKKVKFNTKEEAQVNPQNYNRKYNPFSNKIINSENTKSPKSQSSKKKDINENKIKEKIMKISEFFKEGNNSEKEIYNSNKKSNQNKNNNKIFVFSKHDSDSDSDSESDSDLRFKNKGKTIKENDNKEASKFSRRKQKSQSKKYYSKLNLNDKIEEENNKEPLIHSKMLEKKDSEKNLKSHKEIEDKTKDNINNDKIDRKQSENKNNDNNINKKKESISSINSFKKNDININEILNKKKISNDKIIKINTDEITSNNKFKNVYNDDIKNNDNNINNRDKNNNIIFSENNTDIVIKSNPILKNMNILDGFTRNNFYNYNNLNKNNKDINTNLNTLSPTSKSLNNFKSLSNLKNNYSSTTSIYPEISKNHKIKSIFPEHGDNLNSRKNTNNIPFKKVLEIDTDIGFGCNIVSFEIPKNSSLPKKINQFYPLYGKKIQKKKPIKYEETSFLDDIYKGQYDKKIKKLKLKTISNSNVMTDIPKKISPVFGRTAYTFYSKKDIENLCTGGKINGNDNLYLNTLNNIPPINIKYLSQGKVTNIEENDK